MNFITWLLARMKRKLIGDGQWDWVYKYRRLILEEKIGSIIVTVLGGALWTLFGGCIMMMFMEPNETSLILFKGIIISVPVFYVYNWIAALYELYDTERMATWNRLKE